MEKECFDKFRPPQPTDLMDNVSFCSYPWSNKVYCRMWACLRPTDSEGKYEAFSGRSRCPEASIRLSSCFEKCGLQRNCN